MMVDRNQNKRVGKPCVRPKLGLACFRLVALQFGAGRTPGKASAISHSPGHYVAWRGFAKVAPHRTGNGGGFDATVAKQNSRERCASFHSAHPTALKSGKPFDPNYAA